MVGFDLAQEGLPMIALAFFATEIAGLFGIVYLAARLAIRHERRRTS